MTVSEGIARHLERRYGIPEVVLVRNVQPYQPPPKPLDLFRASLSIPRGSKIALYIGAITFNRGLEQLIDASVHLDHVAVVIMGPANDSSYEDGLRRQAKQLGVLGRTLFFHDPVPPEKVGDYVASADLGVVPTQACCKSYEFEASNKIFHCVMAGKPVAMSDHIEKRMLVERFGIGRLFDETDPRKIAHVLDEMGRVDDEQAREACLEAAKSLNWEAEEERLLEVFATCE